MPHPTMAASVEILTCKNSTSCTTVCESVIARCRRGTRKRAVSTSVIFIDCGLRLFTRAILSFGGHDQLAHLSDAVDAARNDVASLEIDRRVATEPDSVWRAGADHIARQERHELAHIRDERRY